MPDARKRVEEKIERGERRDALLLELLELREEGGYDELEAEEKLDLFAGLLPQEPLTWQGSIRPPLKDQLVYPPVENGPLKTWIGG